MFAPFSFLGAKEGVAPTPPFSPSDISELIGWYDFTDSSQVELDGS